jgi:HlyD family secretion protein
MTGIGDWLAGLLAAVGLAADEPAGRIVQGYVEGEYVQVAAPAAGTLAALPVERGRTVRAGDPLFALDLRTAAAEHDRAAAALAQAEAQLADLQTGRRPEELAVIAAQRAQADAAFKLAEAQLRRQEALVAGGTTAGDRLDQARAAYERAYAWAAQLTAEWQAATLPARPGQIRAAEAGVAMAEAALVQAERRLAELAPSAPADALVEDTYFTVGEWVPAGTPVVSLLPPEGLKLRFFVPEPALAGLAPGDAVGVACDGCPADLTAVVTYLAPEAEYTPPVIYSVGSRDKLVFLAEARPAGDAAAIAALHPGLPVDVELPP